MADGNHPGTHRPAKTRYAAARVPESVKTTSTNRSASPSSVSGSAGASVDALGVVSLRYIRLPFPLFGKVDAATDGAREGLRIARASPFCLLESVWNPPIQRSAHAPVPGDCSPARCSGGLLVSPGVRRGRPGAHWE